MPFTDPQTAAEALLGADSMRMAWMHCSRMAALISPPSLKPMRGGGPVGAVFPEPVIAPHETAAVAMAHGRYLATGKPQAIMAHVTVGLANCVMGVVNAAADNVPLIVMAGRTPITEGARPGSRDVTDPLGAGPAGLSVPWSGPHASGNTSFGMVRKWRP